jgi:hypothetical protein
MVPGFVLIPVVTPPPPVTETATIPFRRVLLCTTWAAARGDFRWR